MSIDEVISSIKPLDRSLEQAARHKMDMKTKPQGSLGLLEEAAIRMALIQGNLDPDVKNPRMMVFAGDHGVAAEGVSAFPAEVTPQMVLNFLAGGAAINVLCRHAGIDLHVVDMGVNYDFDGVNGLIDKKVRKGTRNFLKEDALTAQEARQAVMNGAEAFLALYRQNPCRITGLGEMGIGNTTSATAIISAVTGVAPADLAGRGTGIDDVRLKNKIEVIETALRLRQPDTHDSLDILAKVGGLEIAGMTGALLAAASVKCAVVLDGVISTAAGLLAWLMAPAVKDYLFSGHRSVEHAQRAALGKLGLSPLVDLGMRLGEGTGAALAIRTIDAACAIMREMASFEQAGVSGKE